MSESKPNVEVLATQIEQIQKDVALILKHITGNGNPDKGLIVRMDRIEQRTVAAEKSRDKTLWIVKALFTGVLTSIGLTVWELVRSGAL